MCTEPHVQVTELSPEDQLLVMGSGEHLCDVYGLYVKPLLLVVL